VLVNNAASKGNSTEDFLLPLEDYKFSSWNEVIKGNLTTMFLLSKIIGNIMKKQNYGSIIQIASIYDVITPKNEIYKDPL